MQDHMISVQPMDGCPKATIPPATKEELFREAIARGEAVGKCKRLMIVWIVEKLVVPTLETAPNHWGPGPNVRVTWPSEADAEAALDEFSATGQLTTKLLLPTISIKGGSTSVARGDFKVCMRVWIDPTHEAWYPWGSQRVCNGT